MDERIVDKSAGRQAAGMTEFWKWTGIGPSTSPFRPTKMLPRAEFAPSVLGEEPVAGVKCVKVRSRHPRLGGEVVWWLAPEYGYLVLRRDEISYYPPGSGLDPGQYVLVRSRVKDVKQCAPGVYVPTHVERTVAWISADGSVERVPRRFVFTADQLQVNCRVQADAFDLTAVANQDGGQSELSTACGHSSVLDFSTLLAIELDTGEKEYLAEVYAQSSTTSLAELREQLETILGVPLVGFRGTLGDLASLNQPAIIHVMTQDGEGHFVVVESISGGEVRVLNWGQMSVMSTNELQRWFSGYFLVAEVPEAITAGAEQPRVLCESTIIEQKERDELLERGEYEFHVTNDGGALLRLAPGGSYPPGLQIDVRVPDRVAPRSSANIVVTLSDDRMEAESWAAVLRTNDPVRPTLWLGGYHSASPTVTEAPSG
ncbi:MAG: hypothetical protein JXA57_12130 [Armatimonadetes bacterium]|nr:hypothetical protein [Armatimonadota bacterium]